VPEGNRRTAGLGIGYNLLPGVIADLGYNHAWGADPTVTGSQNSIDPLTHAVVLSGNYHNTLDWVTLSLRFAL
jgi:long-subunit fatty acid transport protein